MPDFLNPAGGRCQHFQISCLARNVQSLNTIIQRIGENFRLRNRIDVRDRLRNAIIIIRTENRVIVADITELRLIDGLFIKACRLGRNFRKPLIADRSLAERP